MNILRPSEREALVLHDALNKQLLMDMYDSLMAQKARTEIQARMS